MQEVIDRLNRALAILLKAQQDLRMEPQSTATQCAGSNLAQAIHSTKATLKNLRQEKEE